MQFATIFVVLSVYILGVKAQYSPYRVVFNKLHKEAPQSDSVTRNKIDIHCNYITQKLDNFNEAENRTWEMRYLSNDYYFKENGPIFIFVGGEFNISEEFLLRSHMVDMAKSLNGCMFHTEHRFYGHSQPTLDLSMESLQYLNVKQALADLAHFITTVKANITGLRNSKVVLVGGSYAGSMVAWFRRFYPHLANGAWASGAPLLAKVDFTEYYETVGKSIKTVGGQECYDRIKNGFKILEDNIKTHNLGKVQQYINICDNFNTQNSRDVATLFSSISNYFASLVQYNTTGDIERACTTIMAASDDVKGVGEFIKLYIGASNYCTNFSYNNDIAVLRDTKPTNGRRLWLYQVCNEFGWHQTSGSANQPFGSSFPLDHFIAKCRDIFGSRFDANTIRAKIDETNAVFGGITFVPNVFYTQGELDSFREMGVKEFGENSALVPLYSHCMDLFSKSYLDTAEMAQLKNRVVEKVLKWIS